MPEVFTTRSDYLREVYFPTVYYTEVLDYTLKEIESEQEAFKELDSLILKANANTARLAETYRERAPSPGQAIRLTESRRIMRDYEAEIEGQRASSAGFAANPGRAGIEAVRVYSAAEGAADRAVAAEAVKIATRAASGISNPALKRKAFVDIMESTGLDYKNLAGVELNRAVRATFDDAYANVVSKAGSQEDAAARAAAGGFATPEKPIAIMRAEGEVSAAESPFSHGKMVSGLTPEDEDLRNLFVNRLRDEATPGKATADEFDSPEQYAKARTAYETAREEGAYLKSDAEWFAADYLSAVQTEAALKRKQEEGPTYEDPYREAQRRALERGGYTPEEVHFMAYRGSPAQARVRPSFARAYADITPQTEQEKLVASLWEQSGEELDVGALEALLNEKAREFRGPLMTTPYGAARSAVKGEDRKGLREAKREANEARQEKYSPENIERSVEYLIALKLRRDGIVKGGLQGEGEPAEVVAPLTGDEERAVAEEGDQLAEAAVAREQALQRTREQLIAEERARAAQAEADAQPIIAPTAEEAPGEIIDEPVDRPVPAEITETPPTAAEITLGPGDIGYEFVDESDAAKPRYRRTEDGFVALSGRYEGRKFLGPSVAGIALTHAERGQYDELADLQRRQRALREREQPEARPLPPVTPTVEAGAPPPGAPPTLGLAGPVTGSPFAPLTPEEAARLEARRLEAEGVAPVNLDTAPMMDLGTTDIEIDTTSDFIRDANGRLIRNPNKR